MNYDIFLDESGLFLETSTNVKERGRHENSGDRKFPSQIAGVVCPAGTITSGNAGSILKSACAAGAIEYTPRFHANQHSGSPGFPRLVHSLCQSLLSKKIQPVRLVNAEEVSFGDRVATYCNILAELLVRVCQQLEAEGVAQVSLNVFAATLVTEDDEKTGIATLDAKAYLEKIHDVFARAALANGFKASRFRWQVSGFQIRSAREDRRLQLADVISYTSHDDFRPLAKHPEASQAMRSTLASFNWSFSCDETITRVRDLVRRESHGSALIALAERATTDGIEKKTLERYESLASEVVSALEMLPPVTQKPQFQIIAGWLNQVAEQRHDLDSSLRCCRWMQNALCNREASLDWPADWLRLLTDTWALTACNHDANTIAGRVYAEQVEALVPKLSSRWEFAGDLMFAFIVKAVHQNDCFDHQSAADRMAAVVGYYQQLDGFFSEAFEGVFPEKVLSDLRARALGTQLQSEIGLMLGSQGDLDRCRAISDQAISEFQHDGDRARQWQYRSELETVAGQWDLAREFLAKSLGLSDFSHDSIAEYIQSTPDDVGKGFALLHWSRIGAMSAAAMQRDESNAFVSAFHRTKTQYTPWCIGDHPFYPAHGILRHVSVAIAGAGDSTRTVECVGRLRRLVEVKPRPIFQLIQIAAHLQCAGLLAKSDRKTAEKLIFGEKKSLAVTAMIAAVANNISGGQPKLHEILTGWQSHLNEQAKSGLDAGKLLAMGRIVGY
ncbi:hypothetical protein CA51_13360 [Rosistilla oblonga]|uniref:hypothetical protein n=1 Tax=Rosistilla oblonga TaxID=2527990 RepID=UPI00118C76FA|nr:hypothetical protein [Rosistilla oblonga]QDV11472.1 hypothetical protein CA51_13360 [Rosistilla oblonga]